MTETQRTVIWQKPRTASPRPATLELAHKPDEYIARRTILVTVLPLWPRARRTSSHEIKNNVSPTPKSHSKMRGAAMASPSTMLATGLAVPCSPHPPRRKGGVAHERSMTGHPISTRPSADKDQLARASPQSPPLGRSFTIACAARIGSPPEAQPLPTLTQQVAAIIACATAAVSAASNNLKSNLRGQARSGSWRQFFQASNGNPFRASRLQDAASRHSWALTGRIHQILRPGRARRCRGIKNGIFSATVARSQIRHARPRSVSSPNTCCESGRPSPDRQNTCEGSVPIENLTADGRNAFARKKV